MTPPRVDDAFSTAADALARWGDSDADDENEGAQSESARAEAAPRADNSRLRAAALRMQDVSARG